MSGYFDNSAELILKPFKKPIAELMKELKDDAPNLISEMKVDPTGYVLSRLYPTAKFKHEPKISSANRFLFAVLGNDGFREWLKEYNSKLLAQDSKTQFTELDPDQIRKDFAEGLKKHADENVMKALLESAELGPIEIFDDYINSDPKQVAAAVVGPVAIAVAVAVVVVVALVYAARTTLSEELRSGTISAFAFSGNELVSFADEMVQTAKSMRAEGKI